MADRPEIFREMESYSNATRPDASTKSLGTPIWNTDDEAVQYSDGTNWRDKDGNVT